LDLPPVGPPLPLHLLQEVPAVKLFLARGRAVRRHFELTGANAAVVTRLCRRLDGLPLGIELAAARLRHQSEGALLRDLEASLNTLSAAFRDVPDRQRTLTATIAWSYELLCNAERGLFEQLGVFVGDPTVDAVTSVCAAGMGPEEGTECLRSLASQSLLRLYEDPVGTPRVAMLQLICEFARDRLAAREDAEAVRRRHAEFYLTLAKSTGPQLGGPCQVDAFRRLQADAGELRNALIWASGCAGSIEVAAQLIGNLWRHWELTGDIGEACRIADNLVDRITSLDPVLAAPALSGTATLQWLQGRTDNAALLHQQALDMYQRVDDAAGIAWSKMCLAVQMMERYDTVSAERLANEALVGPGASLHARAGAYLVLGLLAIRQSDAALAASMMGHSVDLARRSGEPSALAVMLGNYAEAAEHLGQYETAESLLHEALEILRDFGGQNLPATFETLAELYVHRQLPQQAARLLAAAAAYRSDRALPPSDHERQRIDKVIADAEVAAGAIPFALAWRAGSAIEISAMIDEMLDTQNTGQDRR
jgi:tetratricopeptide (TPR) repeat protein